MTAANCSVKRCFEQECFLEVPFFQRAYVWNQDNWEQLLNTLSQESSSIFLGAVILQKRDEIPVYGEGDAVETDAWKRVRIRERAIQGLGNMTILKKALNSKLRNKNFSVKKEEVLKNDLAMLSVAVEVYSASAESWDERTIWARTKALAKEIVKIWPLTLI